MNPEKFNISGEELKQLRSLKGIKQTTIAKNLRITQQAYSKLERKKNINGAQLDNILKALNFSSEDLMKLKSILYSISSQN